MAKAIQETPSILRRKQVEARVGLGRSSIYQYVRAGQFPAPVRVGSRAVGWIASEVDAWLAARIESSRKSE